MDTVAPEEEQIVLLDEDGRAVGVAPKIASHHENTPLHLAFTCYGFDRDGLFLATRRAATKKTWPGAWTNTCCGHPAPGEHLFDAVSRRLAAELGVRAARLDVVVPAVRYRARMDNGIVENEIGPVVRAVLHDTPAPNPDEVAGLRWLPWTAWLAEARHGTPAVAPWVAYALDALAPLGPHPRRWPTIGTDRWMPALRETPTGRRHAS
ncbi:isopentenyl-diphosphate Delta-isomerase [Amycolatopsis sp. NPDC059021]|uniref:isopentenyl-diphosphate Delta-isomerase n=1 Tax=Amycolatopsis sp. NPDC059021 TaxID=3346704 RepID=UPI00366CC717